MRDKHQLEKKKEIKQQTQHMIKDTHLWNQKINIEEVRN